MTSGPTFESKPASPASVAGTDRSGTKPPAGAPATVGRRLRLAHLGVGLVFVVGFLLTGQYLHWFLDHLRQTPDAPRMLYRSTHIYLLWSALLNLALGLHLQLSPTTWRRGLQWVGSVLVLSGPFLLTLAFFQEPLLNDLLRPLSRPAIYSAFAGVLLHAIAAIGGGPKDPA